MNARVQELFHDVADLSPEARTEYFAAHAVDEETREEVEELLAFDSSASAFLQRDVSIAASRSLPQLESAGWRCGPYRLLDVIGRGGMGAVYRAERADGEVTQRLAVKLLPPGAGDAQRERFLQERQILASLGHPNIARMLDAGHGENGQPFLAMEYIDGLPIDVLRIQTERAGKNQSFPEGVQGRCIFASKPRRAPRSEAEQHPGGGGWRAETPRLRHRQNARRRDRFDDDQHADADAGLCQPGAGRRRPSFSITV